ncbi:MAG: hypothetical protein Q9201_003050 [Fulgogasparrea decipioides]
MSTGSKSPLLSVHRASGDEHDVPPDFHPVSRSPHPYARRRPDVPFTTQGAVDSCLAIPSYLGTLSDDSRSNGGGSTAFFDADNRKRRKSSTSSRESGTEADDESEPFLRGLPAPPARLRKGLKNDQTLGTPSPLFTPSYLDDVKRREILEGQFKRRASLQSHAFTDEEQALEIREKFRKRRRAELIRRTTETLLLFGVGYIACRKILLLPCRREIAVATSVVGGTYMLYPFRLFYYHRFQSSEARRSQHFMRIPAAFDPATLLYPVLLPAFVAASLLIRENIHVTLNLVLAIASMPRAIVPSQDSFSGHTSMQWLLSVIQTTFVGEGAVGLDRTQLQLATDPEVLALLYPLHQALLPTLGYLTTTSLLPAELQLLSVSMINLLLLSASPQASILQALLWIGGLLMFVFCRHVLERVVALARIPSWRFRRDDHHIPWSHVMERLLKGFVKGRSGRTTDFEEISDQSDSDEPQKHMAKRCQTRTRAFTLATNGSDKALAKCKTAIPMSTTETTRQQWPMKVDGSPSQNHDEAPRQRSFTLPSNTESMPRILAPHHNKGPIDNLLSFTMPKNFQSLTKAQAIVVKWLYALYTYAVIIIAIAAPIRVYLMRYAMHGQEPIGWAIGYLFGDIAYLRSMVLKFGLEQWIRLPPSHILVVDIRGWVEDVRWQHYGAANTRLLICIHCICTIGLGLAVVFRLSSFVDVDTRRKVFHGMMVVMFLPTIFVDPTFVALALILVFAIFLLLDLFRASQLPPLSRPLTNFLAPYVDGRDHRGPVIVSHIFLLIGCSTPLWLSLASLERSGPCPWEGWEVPTRDLSMISGVVCVGMGDAAASLIGRRYGRRRWCWSGGKSLEGSAAFALAVMLGLGLARLWLLYGGWQRASEGSWLVFFYKVTVAASGASITEAVLTGGNDNVIVPVVLWLLVRGLEM